MSIVTVLEKGQVAIPMAIRQRLGINPGTQLDFEIEGDSIHIRLIEPIKPTQVEDGYGLLVCTEPGERRLSDFDVALTMQADDDRL